MDADLHGLRVEDLERCRPDLADEIQRRGFTAGCAKTLRDAISTSPRRLRQRLAELEAAGRVRCVPVAQDGQDAEAADPKPRQGCTCRASEGKRP